jgi:hypothetical protein
MEFGLAGGDRALGLEEQHNWRSHVGQLLVREAKREPHEVGRWLLVAVPSSHETGDDD